MRYNSITRGVRPFQLLSLFTDLAPWPTSACTGPQRRTLPSALKPRGATVSAGHGLYRQLCPPAKQRVLCCGQRPAGRRAGGFLRTGYEARRHERIVAGVALRRGWRVWLMGPCGTRTPCNFQAKIDALHGGDKMLKTNLFNGLCRWQLAQSESGNKA